MKLLLLLPQQQVDRRTLLACSLDVSQFVVGIPWVLFDYPFCISRCNIYLEEFEVVVIALRQIQDGGGSHADAASAEFKMVVILCTDTRWRSCVRSWWCFDIPFKMLYAFAKVQCGNSIIYISYFSCDFRSTSFSNDFDSNGASFRQMLRYL